MTFSQVGFIKYYTFPIFDNQGVIHAVFTRHGGFSPEPWKSLNFGSSVGDDLVRVIKNREAGLSAVNLLPRSVYDVFQVHSDEVVATDRPLLSNETHLKADAIITDNPDVTLMMRFADCVPILLFDPVNRAIGIVHAGWKGTANQIVKNAVFHMADEYGAKPEDIFAAIGPSIGPDHYMIGSDVAEEIYKSLGDESDQCIVKLKGNIFLDLWKANHLILNNSGVKNIEISAICTHCNLKDWFSHRGENGKTGRFGVVFRLQH